MTTIEIIAVVALVIAVITCLCLAMYRAADRTITALSADASLDPEPHQPRASTEPEPGSVELLLCAAFLIFAIAALGLLWCGFADGMVRWLVHVLAHRY
jgi:hypothetical protein